MYRAAYFRAVEKGKKGSLKCVWVFSKHLQVILERTDVRWRCESGLIPTSAVGRQGAASGEGLREVRLSSRRLRAPFESLKPEVSISLAAPQCCTSKGWDGE